ncbi:MAG: MOSC domain-containing protein [Shewanella sp.]
MQLVGIAYKQKKSRPMLCLTNADISLEKGVADDVFGKPGKRQVTVLSQEQWQAACDELDNDLEWQTRRANLLISGYEFSAADVGKQIIIGEQVALLITGETAPCTKIEKQADGLQNALTPDWRGGVTCKVVTSGPITLFDTIAIL